MKINAQYVQANREKIKSELRKILYPAADGKSANFAAMTFAPVSYPDQEAIDKGIDALVNAEAQNQAMAEAMLKPVVDLIQNATTYQEVMANLAAQYPDMDTKALESRLARVMFAADAWGMINSDHA